MIPMELWQTFICICAGVVTLFTLVEKLRGTASFKKLDKALKDLQIISGEFTNFKKDMDELKNELATSNDMQILQKDALLALLRNDLYRCFRDNRNIGAWTDDDFQVQTTLHVVYRALKNDDRQDEEEIWWARKLKWKIVTDSEYQRMVKSYHEKLINAH